jgi:Fe-S oxidoreductase
MIARMVIGLGLTVVVSRTFAIPGIGDSPLLHPLGYGVNSVLEATFVLFSRRPNALGPLEPMRSGGTVHTAGVRFAVLGPLEACTGDPARRLGNEFVFSMLAQQNVDTLNDAGIKKVVASCPHCFNSIAREYPQLGGNYEVIHHTQLLAKLVEEGKLQPVTKVDEKITYHDPCFLGRHNKVFSPPREIIEAVPGATAEEMLRCKNQGFCCGAGGARMWLEERTGKRINEERIAEALALDPDIVSTACPYCVVMLGDAVNAKKAAGEAKQSLEVIDVAQLLARSVKLREQADAEKESPCP